MRIYYRGTDDCEYYILTLYEIVGGGNFVQYRVVSLASLAKSQRSRNLPHAYLLEYHQKLVLFRLEHILDNMNNHLEDLTDIQMRLVSKLVKSESQSSSCYDLGL